MSLFDFLQTVRGRLRIFETAAPARPSHPKIRTRTVTLGELATEIRSEEVRALAELPIELGIELPKIYEAAGIKPPAHGWTVERLQHLLKTESFRGMEREAVRKAVLKILGDEKVEAEDVVRDAIARDQALDAFETFARSKFEQRTAARERRLAELTSQRRVLEEEEARLTDELRREREEFDKWHERKRAGEREMAEAIAHLVDRPVITGGAGS